MKDHQLPIPLLFVEVPGQRLAAQALAASQVVRATGPCVPTRSHEVPAKGAGWRCHLLLLWAVSLFAQGLSSPDAGAQVPMDPSF
jgi:hypothetical protein